MRLFFFYPLERFDLSPDALPRLHIAGAGHFKGAYFFSGLSRTKRYTRDGLAIFMRSFIVDVRARFASEPKIEVQTESGRKCFRFVTVGSHYNTSLWERRACEAILFASMSITDSGMKENTVAETSVSSRLCESIGVCFRISSSFTMHLVWGIIIIQLFFCYLHKQIGLSHSSLPRLHIAGTGDSEGIYFFSSSTHT